MGFEPDQPRSHMKSVNEFKDWMTDTLEVSWSVLGHVLSEEQSKDGSDRVSNDGGSRRDASRGIE